MTKNEWKKSKEYLELQDAIQKAKQAKKNSKKFRKILDEQGIESAKKYRELLSGEKTLLEHKKKQMIREMESFDRESSMITSGRITVKPTLMNKTKEVSKTSKTNKHKTTTKVAAKVTKPVVVDKKTSKLQSKTKAKKDKFDKKRELIELKLKIVVEEKLKNEAAAKKAEAERRAKEAEVKAIQAKLSNSKVLNTEVINLVEEPIKKRTEANKEVSSPAEPIAQTIDIATPSVESLPEVGKPVVQGDKGVTSPKIEKEERPLISSIENLIDDTKTKLTDKDKLKKEIKSIEERLQLTDEEKARIQRAVEESRVKVKKTPRQMMGMLDQITRKIEVEHATTLVRIDESKNRFDAMHDLNIIIKNQASKNKK